MARELVLNPEKLGSLANNGQEPWKAPLPEFIEHIYEKRHGKSQPDDIRSFEVKLEEKRKKKTVKKESTETPIKIT